MTILYSVDPGDTSGYVIADVELFEADREFRIVGLLESGEFIYPNGVLAQLHKARMADRIIIEDFIVRRSLIGNKIYALRCIGAFQSMWPDKCVFQQPSEKARVPDQILRDNNMWAESLHVRDAMRHLLIYLYKWRGGKLMRRYLGK